jgi:hypothetical protein
MKPKKMIVVIFVALILQACNCRTLTIPLSNLAATPSPLRPSSEPQSNTPFPPPPVTASAAPFNISWDDRSLFRQRITSTYQGVLGKLPGASMYHLAFSLSDPPTSISGMEEVRYTNQENMTLKEVDFAIFPEILGGDIKVSKITLDGQLVDPIFSTGLMRVKLPTPFEPGRSGLFHIEFSITVPTLGEDFYYGIYGYNDGILSLAHAYPTILVYNDQGWNSQTPDLNGDPLFSDTSYYLVSIDAPENLILVASGTEVDRQESTGRQHVLYADGPARDFYLAASPNFNKKSEKVGEITYNSFAPADLTQFSQSLLKTAEAAIDDFSRRYAAYPYTEFNIVPIVTSAGGVEFPGMTALAKGIYSQSIYLESVVAHEVSHQWFYDLVGNETQQQPWLDESLAQFVTWQYFFDRYGDQAAQSFRDAIQGRWDKLNGQKIPIGGPVTAYTKDEYGAIIYGRGLFFFLALRQKIGQVNFDIFLQDYTKTFAWDIATTDDFKMLAEQHCNCNLTPLFQEWVYP